jgi:hypothetical protein
MSEAMLPVTLTVNGRELTRTAPVRMHLADFLRREAGLTGTHVGCEHGVCGACTVIVDGVTTRGCLMLAVQADGCDVRTVEGLAREHGPQRLAEGEARPAYAGLVQRLQFGVGGALRHTVEIGDFIIDCSAELWTDSGCDPICPVKGQPPVALRCQGGAVDYLTPLVCLDTLLAADFLCAGYRNGPVSSYCFSTVGAAASRGPFGVEEESECSPGQDDFPCLDTSQSATGVSLWHTSFYAPPSQPLCGSWSIAQDICNGTIRREASQSGCTPVGAPISYA